MAAQNGHLPGSGLLAGLLGILLTVSGAGAAPGPDPATELPAAFAARALSLSPADYRTPQGRERLLDRLDLSPAELVRYRAQLRRAPPAGFVIKPAREGLPCLVAASGSYEARATATRFIDLIADYPYQPFRGQRAGYERMVTLHELGHCFEHYGGVRGETFADVFALLLLACESVDSREFVARQWLMRLLALSEADTSHFSLPALRYLARYRPRQAELCHAPERLLAEAHAVVAASEQGFAGGDRNAIVRQSRYLTLSLMAYFDGLNQIALAGDVSDRGEALYDRISARKAATEDELARLSESLEPGDVYGLGELVLSLAQAMYTVRELNDDLFNPVQVAAFRSDVRALFRASHLDPLAEVAEASDEGWLQALAARRCDRAYCLAGMP